MELQVEGKNLRLFDHQIGRVVERDLAAKSGARRVMAPAQFFGCPEGRSGPRAYRAAAATNDKNC